MKISRRKAREDALQILYQIDMNQGLTAEAGVYHFENHFMKDVRMVDPFTQRLVTGVARNLAAIDKTIETASEHWRTERMAVVDRNLLRLGVFELNFCDDIPTTVSINEMIEVAKQFGSESSASFVNGLLDRVKNAMDRPGKTT